MVLGCSRNSQLPAAPADRALAVAESVYADLRDVRDRLEVLSASGRETQDGLSSLPKQILAHNALRAELARRLSTLDSTSFRTDDRRALRTMKTTLGRDLDSLTPAAIMGASAAEAQPECDYDAAAMTRLPGGLDSLRKRMYACYGWSQSHLTLHGDTLDRLSILGTLGREEDVARRRQLFLSLQPVWQAVNGDNRLESPYRQLIAGEARARSGVSARPTDQAALSGVPPDSVEPWLIAILETWHNAEPDSLIEPWDWYYVTGRTSRELSRGLSRERIVALNEAVYRALGADLDSIRVQYDINPREGKTPVAYTTFGLRPRRMNGRWRLGEPWVFATYRTGGVDNLNELLHETGHAVHIAAIRTRPAFADWPDSDPFTEGIADIIALNVYEPAWQLRWLGDSVPLVDGLRGRYGGIVLDVAWAVFELRMLHNPAADPNTVWTGLTNKYLRIQPHPELSWWAMRGQLIDAPGYMMNYAVGAILAAAIRARTRALRPSHEEDSGWYQWMTSRLYRFGLERPTREVIEEYLGAPVSPGPLLDDLRRMQPRARR
jgi:hypothetical protein